MKTAEVLEEKDHEDDHEGDSENEQKEEILSDEDILQIVSFSLLNEVEYGIDILSIHEILKMPAITRLPNSPEFIKGVLNLRGNVLPVVNVRVRFGLPESPRTESTRIIVVEVGSRLIGLLVDEVFQVVRIPKRNVDTPNELIEGVSAEFIDGIGRLKNRLIVLLKLENMLFEIDGED